MAELEQIEVAGRSVAVARGSAGPLVLLTRLAARDAGIWDGLWPALAEEFSVAAVDLPQPSVEALADPRATLAGYARILAEVGTALSAGPVHLVGWNGGAQIALQFAIHHRKKLASMTLLTPFHEPRDPRPLGVGLDIIEAILQSGRRDLYAYYWFMAGLSDRFVHERFDQVQAMVRKRLEADPFVALDVGRAMAWMRALRRAWASDEEIGAIAVPTLILAAGRNRWHAGPTPEMARDLNGLIAGSTLRIFDDLGPLLALEAPDLVLNELLPFLRRAAAADH